MVNNKEIKYVCLIILLKIVKYMDQVHSKVDFLIKIQMTYLNDENKEAYLEIDLTLNQFYALFNDFQKIDSMIKTLV